MAKKSNIIVGLDVGTTKICAIVGEPTEHGVSIIGIGEVPSNGLKKGVVINIESTVKLAQAISIPVIASGGITNLDDIRRLCEVEDEGIMGAITGRAIYEGTLDFAEAQKLANGN